MSGPPWWWKPWPRLSVLRRFGKSDAGASAALEPLPSEVLQRALPEHLRFRFEVEHRLGNRHGATVVVKLREGVFADGEAERRVYVPYRKVHTDLDAVVRMIVDTSEHAMEW